MEGLVTDKSHFFLGNQPKLILALLLVAQLSTWTCRNFPSKDGSGEDAFPAAYWYKEPGRQTCFGEYEFTVGHNEEAWCDREKRCCSHPVAGELEVFRGSYN